MSSCTCMQILLNCIDLCTMHISCPLIEIMHSTGISTHFPETTDIIHNCIQFSKQDICVQFLRWHISWQHFEEWSRVICKIIFHAPKVYYQTLKTPLPCQIWRHMNHKEQHNFFYCQWHKPGYKCCKRLMHLSVTSDITHIHTHTHTHTHTAKKLAMLLHHHTINILLVSRPIDNKITL